MAFHHFFSSCFPVFLYPLRFYAIIGRPACLQGPVDQMPPCLSTDPAVGEHNLAASAKVSQQDIPATFVLCGKEEKVFIDRGFIDRVRGSQVSQWLDENGPITTEKLVWLGRKEIGVRRLQLPNRRTSCCTCRFCCHSLSPAIVLLQQTVA